MNETISRRKAHSNTRLNKFIVIGIVVFIIILLLVLFFELQVATDIRYFSSQGFNWIIIFGILILIAFLVSILIVISYKEYWEYFARKNSFNRGAHMLTIDNLFENDNRRNIIKTILEEPGIHNNELIRRCNLQKGQLQWHLQVLLQYNIIRKEKMGQYSVYFPSVKYTSPKRKTKLLLKKSKTTFKILNIIEENPGINASTIASMLNLSKSSVKYHIDKFIRENMIFYEQDGRVIKLRVKNE